MNRIIHKLQTMNPWHFLWMSILLSEILGIIFNSIQSYLWWGYLSRDLLLMGLIDSLLVPFLVAPFVIYFLKYAKRLEERDENLATEMDGLRESKEILLREREALYRSVVEDQTEMINRFRPDGTVLFVNTAACRYFGKGI